MPLEGCVGLADAAVFGPEEPYFCGVSKRAACAAASLAMPLEGCVGLADAAVFDPKSPTSAA
jgi:hypothetical protein